MHNTPKQDVMAIGNAIRNVEKALAHLHCMAERAAKRHADILGLDESQGDFTAMSGGTPKPPPPPPPGDDGETPPDPVTGGTP